ncbi:piggyBac transposable element-derived protein 3 [Trichonephila inaurata madagascariensis]|uniref:PiggyBac transposable element-derived protein 3 n=1 Tax=Trichonephila inaurata madagascariensis TaxID=2747483 RepID=A0A8X6XI13_9ARAC|nr:piggyBac transposable element-derived protein 3 [Trichonephila inaurata madagascariensis]
MPPCCFLGVELQSLITLLCGNLSAGFLVSVQDIADTVPVEDKQLYGLGGAVVKHLVGNIPTAKVTHLCTDRYFTGRAILDYLVSRNVYLIGTVMTNRTDGVTGSFPKDTDMERGSPVSR